MLRRSATTTTPPTRAATLRPELGRARPTSPHRRPQTGREQPLGPASLGTADTEVGGRRESAWLSVPMARPRSAWARVSSPVSRIGRSPRARNCAMAWAEVSLMVSGPALTGRHELEAHPGAGHPCATKERRPQRPQPRGADTHRDQRVHRRRTVVGVGKAARWNGNAPQTTTGVLGGVVDGRADAVELVQLLLDPGGQEAQVIPPMTSSTVRFLTSSSVVAVMIPLLFACLGEGC